MLVTDRFKEPNKERIIDMRNKPVDNLGDPYRIESNHPNGSFEINVKHYLKQGMPLLGIAINQQRLAG